MKKRIGGLLLAAVAALWQVPSAEAALVLDLRLASPADATIGPADAGKVIPIQVWAVVTGAAGNTDTTDEGIEYAYYNVLSNGVNAGDITAATLTTPFNATGSQVGQLGLDHNGDGVNDLGAATAVRGTQNARPAVAATSFAGATDGTNAAVPNGREWLLQTIQFTVGSQLPAGQLQFAVQTVAGGLSPSFRVREDGVARLSTSATAYSAGTPVNLQIVPEPASLSLLGLGALSLLGRRNRRK